MNFDVMINREDAQGHVLRIDKEDLEAFVAADPELSWESYTNSVAENGLRESSFKIAWNGAACVEGDGYTVWCEEVPEALAVKLVHLANAIGAVPKYGSSRLEVRKGFFGKEKIVEIEKP